MPSKGIEAHLNGNCIADIRADFIELYQRRRYTLDDVMRHFAERGVKASKQQWKTQISIWRIRKNSHGGEMAFAAKKAQERHRLFGKDTIFIVRGKRRSVRDIDRGVKRLRIPKDDSAATPETPEGVTYFTPPYSPSIPKAQPITPVLGSATSFPEDHLWNISAEQCPADDDSSDHQGCYDHRSAVVAAKRQHWGSDFALLETLDYTNLYIPALNDDTEIFASSSRTFTGQSLRKVADGMLAFDDLTVELAGCFNDMQAAIHSYEAGRMASARHFWNKGLRLLPQVVSSCHIFLLVYIVRLSIRGSPESEKLGAFFLSAAHVVGTRLLGPYSPLVQMLDVMLRSGEAKDAIMGVGVSHAADYLADSVHSDVTCLLYSAHRYMSWVNNDWHGVIHHCRRMIRVYEEQPFAPKYHWKLDSLLWQARAYLRLRSFSELTDTMSQIDSIFRDQHEGMSHFRAEYSTLCEEYTAVQCLKVSLDPKAGHQQQLSTPPQNLLIMYLRARERERLGMEDI